MPRRFSLPDSEVTPRSVFARRRDFLKLGAAGAGALLLGAGGRAEAADTRHGEKLAGVKPGAFTVPGEKANTFEEVTSYNNFYEFGTDKTDPKDNAGSLKTRPWTVAIEGEVKKPAIYDIDALLKLASMEERVYRLRCVEGWSMVVPWVGYSLAELIRKVEPTGNAKYVQFVTLADKAQMPGFFTSPSTVTVHGRGFSVPAWRTGSPLSVPNS